MDANVPDLALIRARKRELKMLLDCVQNDDVAVQLVSSLLIDKASEELRLAELRWSLS